MLNPNERFCDINLTILEIEIKKKNDGLSPSGKATDFDSVIPQVRIPPAQPTSSIPGHGVFLLSFFFLSEVAQ